MQLIRKIFSSHQETVINFLWRVVQIIGKQGATFFIFLVCAQQLSPYDFGVYNYVFSTIFLLIIFSDFGVSIATSKFTAEYVVSDKKKLQLLLFNSALIIFGLSTVIALVLFFFWEFFFKYKTILYCLPLLYFVPLSALYDGIFRGMKQFKKISVVYLVVGLVSLPLFYILILRFQLHGAFISQNIYYGLLTLILIVNSRLTGIKSVVKIDYSLIKKVLGYSVVIGLADIGLFLYTRADIIILGNYGLIEEISYYEIVNKMFLLMIIPAQILASVVAPDVTRFFTQKKYRLIRKNVKRDVIFLFVVGAVLATFSYLIFPKVFSLVFPNYETPLLIALMNIILIIIPFRYFSTFLSIGYITPSGNAKISTYSLLCFGLLNIVLDFLLIEPFGLKGVIYATLISQMLFIFCKDSIFYYLVIKRRVE